jgi:uncharacterized protein YaaW (UPF0174 family)
MMHDELILLSRVTDEERQGLATLIGCKSAAPEDLVQAIHKESQSVFGRLFSKPLTYAEIVIQCLDKLKVGCNTSDPVPVLEAKLVHKVIGDAWARMTPAQREQLQHEMSRAAAIEGYDRNRFASLGPIAALSVAQLSGFGIYLFATTALSAVTGVAGVVLPFVAYTTMSSAISFVIGPVGWIGAGLFAIWKLTGPDYKKLIPAVLMIAALRDKYTPKHQPLTPKEGGWLRWVLLAIIVVIVYSVWPSSPTQIPPSPQAVSAQPARPPAANPKAKPATQTAPAKHRAAAPVKPQQQGDLRHCLSLKNDAEIARCANGR